MNGYTMQAKGCRKKLQELPAGPTREELESKAHIYELLAGLSEKEKEILFDSGAYNDICQGFLLLALDQAGASTEAKESAQEALKVIFDSTGAAEARARYAAGPRG